MEPTENKKKDNPGYKAGTFVAYVLLFCLTAIIVALTFKFIMWLF